MSVRHVTVAICTWNRHALLRQTLEEMTHLEVPEGVTWELLVVNNNCTDATDVVLADYAGQLPLRRLFQPQPGLSNARNLASLMANGEYIIWTDDDVLVSPKWLVEYVHAFNERPEASIFGGPITPWFPHTPPVWLEQSWAQVSNAYASVNYGDSLLPLSGDRVPFGANMAVRMDCVAAYPYNPRLGVRPGSRMGGEETDMIRRALQAGRSGWWIPTACVRHYIPPERQTLKYLRTWFYAYGIYLGQRDESERSTAFLLGRPRWLWRQLIVTELRYQTRRHTSPPRVWMTQLIAASTARGQIRSYTRPKAEERSRADRPPTPVPSQ